MRVSAITLCVGLLLAGCGVADDEADVREATEGFYAAVRAGDGEAACDLLSAEAAEALEGQTGQACGDAITGLEYEGGRVEAAVVYVTSARVDLSGGESAFLSDEADGWRIVGVACRPDTGKPRDRPLECELET